MDGGDIVRRFFGTMGSGDLEAAAILELRGDRLARGAGYFASPFPAQEHRARFAEKR